MARDGMLAGSSCLKIANALFIQYRRWTQDVPGIFQYYVFFHYYVSVYAINRRYSYIPEGTFLPRKEGSFRGRKIFVRKEAFE